jgi:hypothetical protein
LLVPAAAHEAQDKPATPEAHHRALVKEYYDATSAFWKAQTDEERQQASARVAKLPLRLSDLAEKNPKSPLALDALVQRVSDIVPGETQGRSLTAMGRPVLMPCEVHRCAARAWRPTMLGQSVTWVIVEEVKSGDWGMGGKALTTADVKALAARKPTP